MAFRAVDATFDAVGGDRTVLWPAPAARGEATAAARAVAGRCMYCSFISDIICLGFCSTVYQVLSKYPFSLLVRTTSSKLMYRTITERYNRTCPLLSLASALSDLSQRAHGAMYSYDCIGNHHDDSSTHSTRLGHDS
mmetsp:Transcript_29782/g.65562  ORF Transcript_29782/g.65562 Transcript_29782/m.65562 type:complete len:137 (-) Transcript_29782:19-429(-)